MMRAPGGEHSLADPLDTAPNEVRKGETGAATNSEGCRSAFPRSTIEAQ